MSVQFRTDSCFRVKLSTHFAKLLSSTFCFRFFANCADYSLESVIFWPSFQRLLSVLQKIPDSCSGSVRAFQKKLKIFSSRFFTCSVFGVWYFSFSPFFSSAFPWFALKTQKRRADKKREIYVLSLAKQIIGEPIFGIVYFSVPGQVRSRHRSNGRGVQPAQRKPTALP